MKLRIEMDQENLPWLSLNGISRTTIIVVVVIIVVLVILLIVRAIMVRRKADEALSKSSSSSSDGKRIKHKRRDDSHRYETRAAIQDKPTEHQIPVIVNAPIPIVQPPIVSAPVVQFQQGSVVEAKPVINTEKSEPCASGNCGAQLEASPQLVQAQQNIHQPTREIPAYPQRQPIVRNPRPAARIVQNQVVAEPINDEEVQDKPVTQPRSNYRLVRGQEQ